MSSQPNPAWKKFDPPFDSPTNLEGAEFCYYARERLSRGGYSTETNQLIRNFKIEASVQQSNISRWNKYKLGAVARFADELMPLLPDGMAIATIPPSAARGDPLFDPRFDLLFQELQRRRPDLAPCDPIVRSVSVAPVHSVEVRPSIEEILASLRYVGFPGPVPTQIVFIDDVVTAGKHFSACRRLILENCPGIHVYGAFWAKTVWPEPEPVDLSGIVSPYPDWPDDMPSGR